MTERTDARRDPQAERAAFPFPARFPANLDIKAGVIVHDAEAYATRRGQIKVTFRIRTPRSPAQPPKFDREGRPLPWDFFQVVAYGERWLSYLPRLTRGRKVLVLGWTQSRDLPDGRVAVETVAEQIFISDSGFLEPSVPEPTEASFRPPQEE